MDEFGQANRQPDECTLYGQKSRKHRTRLCRNYPLGTCRYGDNCSYLHVSPTPPSTSQLVPPIHTITRSLISVPAFCSPSLGRITNSHPAGLSTNVGREIGQSVPAQLDGLHLSSRRESSRRPFPRANAPNVDRSDCPDSESVRKWRASVETYVAPFVGDELDMPHPPPSTPASVAGELPSLTSLEDTAASSTEDPVRPYNWEEDEPGSTEPSRWPPPQFSSRNAQQSAKSVRHRNQFFKTKPCRFYSEPGGCVKGDRCNFIHEYPDEGRQPTGLVVPAEIYSESEAEPDLSGAESSVQSETFSPQSPGTGSVLEHTSEHKKSKKNFYPVTWRVVGGGVMMSGQREVCDNFMAGRCTEGEDCRYAHPDADDSDYVFPSLEPAPVYSPLSPGPLVSPVAFAYPVIFSPISPPHPFVLPVIPGSVPPSAATPQIQTPKNRQTHNARGSLTITPVVQPNTLYPTYTPCHYVDEPATLVEQSHALQQPYMHRDRSLCAERMSASRPIARPVSTPPTPVHAHAEAGNATRLFAAEMP